MKGRRGEGTKEEAGTLIVKNKTRSHKVSLCLFFKSKNLISSFHLGWFSLGFSVVVELSKFDVSQVYLKRLLSTAYVIKSLRATFFSSPLQFSYSSKSFA